MANHVNSYLNFREINEEGKKVLEKLFERFDKYNSDNGCHMAYAFVDNIDDMNNSTVSDMIGAKWGFVQDYDTHGIAMFSAWRQPQEFVEKIVDKISEVDENLLAVFTYEDEMPNFIGVDVYTSEGLQCGDEVDDDEIRELLITRYPELGEQWDADEEEWIDGGDLYCDYVYGFIDEWQTEESESMIEYLKEE